MCVGGRGGGVGVCVGGRGGGSGGRGEWCQIRQGMEYDKQKFLRFDK